jgi:hypothetical protein
MYEGRHNIEQAREWMRRAVTDIVEKRVHQFHHCAVVPIGGDRPQLHRRPRFELAPSRR